MADDKPIEYDDVHHFFGLSYNHYLVVPRSLLQSMPRPWQKKLVDLLAEMLETPAGQAFEEAHYLVQRTDPAIDDEIHEAQIWNTTRDHADDEVEVPDVKVIDDPFYNYRHPCPALFPR